MHVARLHYAIDSDMALDALDNCRRDELGIIPVERSRVNVRQVFFAGYNRAHCIGGKEIGKGDWNPPKIGKAFALPTLRGAPTLELLAELRTER